MEPMLLAERLGLALVLGVFLGLAFEDVYKRTDRRAPGGVRTFPLLALAGGALYLLEPGHASAFSVGLVALGAWHAVYLHDAMRTPDGVRPTLIVPVSSLSAFLLGPMALTQPPWAAVGLAVASALLLGARERLHGLVTLIPGEEVFTAGKFLVLIGVILPLVPNEPVIPHVPVTPYQAWMAVVAVCTFSYASYLIQRYAPLRHGVFVSAVLGGLYSSTATTVVLARRLTEPGAPVAELGAGIVVATAMMYLRITLIIALFNTEVALAIAPAMGALFGLALMLTAPLWRHRRVGEGRALPVENPLQVTAAVVFAALFIVVAVVSRWAQAEFGQTGIFVLSAVVGIADVDPFVLSLIEGSVPSLSPHGVAAAILIATSTNNLAKGVYAAGFGGAEHGRRPALLLVAVAVLGLAAAWLTAR
ncbi:uncharacterized membrane protein (DUF4010 family) [Azospirillum fermentarium]|uniref:MgtC/SapB family protein n=1 Tax=Azospirillum fermentarium TaxID=1233114 RepID=UPI0022264F09|nr:DUF4010 domain-containing protein [Azospirillum fermentarium]MCW2244872.1 uncharacterized membrane protein (DUF4010 family) [Azospirillum fermentarium]